jgi:hypothetical protein
MLVPAPMVSSVNLLLHARQFLRARAMAAPPRRRLKKQQCNLQIGEKGCHEEFLRLRIIVGFSLEVNGSSSCESS